MPLNHIENLASKEIKMSASKIREEIMNILTHHKFQDDSEPTPNNCRGKLLQLAAQAENILQWERGLSENNCNCQPD